MTVYEKLWNIAFTANGIAPGILFDSMKEPLRPYIVEEMNKIAKEIHYDGWTYDSPASEYPESIYMLVWEPVRKATLRFLEDNHPVAWFKPMFMTVEQQKELGLPV